MDDDLIQRARAVAEELLPAFDILAAYAYGSRVSGTPRANSDLDVGYFLRGYRDGARLSLRDELALADRMTDRLGVDIDLRDLGGAPLEVRGRIMEEGVRLYSGDFHERVELEADTYSRYHDYKSEFEERLGIYVAELRRLAAIPEGDLLADPDRVASAKYNFVAAIEACIDIANHVIAAEGFRPPKDNADSFVVLVEKDMLPEAMREHLRSMARFRNRLVHVYWDVDDDLVAEYLHGPLGDLDRFAREISQRMVAPGE